MDNESAPPRSGAAAYRALVSYSHAADGELAPALRSTSPDFSRPWARPRATRGFRENTRFSADPALSPAIERALRDSVLRELSWRHERYR